MNKHLFNRYTFVGSAVALFSMSLNLTSCDLLSKNEDKEPTINQDSIRLDSIRQDSIRLVSIRLDSIRLDSIKQDSIMNNQACPGTASQPYAILYPNGGEHLKVGQTIKIKICTSDPEKFPISGDRRPGIVLIDETGNGAYVAEFTDIPVVEWTILSTLDSFRGPFSTVGEHLRIQVNDYELTTIYDLSDADFTIEE